MKSFSCCKQTLWIESSNTAAFTDACEILDEGTRRPIEDLSPSPLFYEAWFEKIIKSILLKNLWKIYATGKKNNSPKEPFGMCLSRFATSCSFSDEQSRLVRRKIFSPVLQQQLNSPCEACFMCRQLGRCLTTSVHSFQSAKRWRRNFKKTMKKSWKSCGWF